MLPEIYTKGQMVTREKLTLCVTLCHCMSLCVTVCHCVSLHVTVCHYCVILCVERAVFGENLASVFITDSVRSDESVNCTV